MRKRLSAVVFWMLGICLGASRGEMVVVESIEWKGCKADVILVGTVVDVKVERGRLTGQAVVFKVLETIKGEDEGEVGIWIDRAEPKMEKGQRLLVFLADGETVKAWGARTIRLSADGEGDVVNLEKPGGVYSSKMRKVEDAETILKAVREAAASGVEHSIWEGVPWGSAIFKELWAGSGVSMVVPALPEYRERYLQMARSEDANERAQGAAELRKFAKDDEVVALLRELLKDGTENFSYRNADRYANVDFSVRRAAYESLKAWGEDVEEMAVRREPTEGEQSALRSRYWTKLFTEGLPPGWRVIAAGDGELPKGFRLAEGAVADAGDVVKVDLSDGRRRIGLVLLSKDMKFDGIPEAVDGMEYWGINGRSSQGARHFFGTKGAPDEMRKTLKKYIPLEEGKF